MNKAFGTAQPFPEHACPLCGGPNACAPACSGDFATPCWCRGQRFSAELLARVPAAQRGIACICAACAAGVTSQESASPDRPPPR